MANCKYNIGTLYFDSYEELINHITKNLASYLNKSSIEDLIFSEGSLQTAELILKIKLETHISTSLIEFNPQSGEFDENFDKYQALSDYVDKSKFFESFNEKEYHLAILDEYIKKGIQPDLAKEQADLKLFLDKEVGQFSAELHKVVRSYFKRGNVTAKELYKLYGETFNLKTLSELVVNLLKLKSYFKKTYGEDCKIIPHVTVTAKASDQDKEIAGTIDLVVVDRKDRAHIFLVSGSSKDSDSLLEVRKQKKDFILGFYRHILALKGINVTSMDLGLIPIQLVVDESHQVKSLIFSEDLVDIRNSSLMGKLENKLLWLYGEYFDKINSKIEIELPKVVNSDALDKLKQHTKAFFPDIDLSTVIFNLSIDDFIKTSVVDSNDYTQGRYMIRNGEHPIYIQTDKDKSKCPKVREAVKNYIIKYEEKSTTFLENYISQLEKVLKKNLPISELASGYNKDETVNFLNVNLANYIGTSWTIDRSNPAFESAGILTLKNNVTKLLDFIVLRKNAANLNNIIRLSKGSSILGCHMLNEQALQISNILNFTVGNATLMQVMDMINSNSSNFGNFKIGIIKALNVDTGEVAVASTSELKTSYSRLCSLTNVQNNLNSVEFASDLDIFRYYINNALSGNLFDYLMSESIKLEFEKVNFNISEDVLKVLNLIRTKMERRYAGKLKNVESIAESLKLNDLVAFIYTQLCKTILFYLGVPFTLSRSLTQWGTSWREESTLNGTQVSNPSTIPDENILRIVALARQGFNGMTQEIMDNWEPFRNIAVEDLWEAKGYSSSQNTIFGNLYHLYENFFVRNEDGTLNDRLLLKRPEELSDPAEAKFLREWLRRMDALRYNSEKEKNDALLNGSYYYIPLVEAGLEGKIRETKDPIGRAYGESKLILTYMKKAFLRDENNVYIKEELDELLDWASLYVVTNRLAASLIPARRDALLAEHHTGFWETNLETLYAHFLYASIRKKHMDSVLPAIKALRLVGLVYGQLTAINMENFDDYLQKYTKSHIHNLSILSKELQDILGSVSPLKFMASTLAMGFNANTGIRNLLESVWKIPLRISTKFYAKEDCFTAKDWGKAMLLMIEDVPEFANRVTLIEALNLRFRILDMDANRIADKIKSHKSGITHTTDRLMFWFSVAPDYFNRMSMLIALMIHDGCWDACSFDKNGFHYNWRLDKRFDIYAQGEKGKLQNLDLYNKLRGEYLFLLRTYNEENGTRLKEGDNVPLPYTTKQITALKDFSDTVFGFYDHDLRAMVERNAIASLFTLFKTYLTASRTMWFLAPGAYNLGETEQMINETTGKPMFLKIITNSDGLEIMIPTDEDTGIPWILARKSYMEGIVYSLKHMYDDVKRLGWSEMWRQTRNNRVRWNNLKLGAFQLLIAFIFAALVKSAISSYKLWNIEDKKQNTPTFSSILRDLVVTNGLADLLGSLQDANIFESVTDVSLNAEPAALSIINRLFTSTSAVLFGDKSAEYWLNANFGAYRSGKVLIEGVSDLL